MIKILSILLFLGGLSFSVYSQGSAIAVATAGVSATIVEPGIIPSDAGNGVVIVSASLVLAPVKTRLSSGCLSLPIRTGSFTGVFFCVSGNEGYTFSINVPSTPMTVMNGTNVMEITSFTTESALNARSEKIAGVYVSVSPFDVTVNYN
jgi:hypothetical protein